MIDKDKLLAEFRIMFSEFSAISDDIIKANISLALSIFAKCKDATLYLTAFFVEKSIKEDANGGDIQNINSIENLASIKVGNKSITLREQSDDERLRNANYFNTNKYGKIYLILKKACASYVLVGCIA